MTEFIGKKVNNTTHANGKKSLKRMMMPRAGIFEAVEKKFIAMDKLNWGGSSTRESRNNKNREKTIYTCILC